MSQASVALTTGAPRTLGAEPVRHAWIGPGMVAVALATLTWWVTTSLGLK